LLIAKDLRQGFSPRRFTILAAGCAKFFNTIVEIGY